MVQTKSGRPDMVQTKSGQTQPDGRRGSKKLLFFRVSVSFSSLFLPFHQHYVYEMPFLQKKSVYLAFSSCRSANCNCPPRIGGHHFLLCQHTNTEDIAGQSANQYYALHLRERCKKKIEKKT